MKKILMTCVLLVAGSTAIFAQNEKFCGTDEMMRKVMELDPDFINRLAQLEEFTAEYIKTNSHLRTSGTVQYVIPVVFHIIHTYGGENISKAQVLDAVEVLNKSFQKLYGDSVDVASAFRPIIADSRIEFRLARLDPSGNCTDGITRTYSEFTHSAGDNVKGLIDWPSNQYFNIWVVANIASGAAGYAYYPGIAAPIDGVVILNNYTGYIGTNNGSNYAARSLTHEAGHWLNLAHTWGSTNSPGLPANCNDDDYVQDTPNTIGVPNFTCDTTQVTCNSLDNVQNYMDYASCHLMFTEGQKMRMHAALNAGFGGRDNLHTSANLLATGTNDGFIPGPCVPIADVSPVVKRICTGTTLTFTDISWRAEVLNWQWDFPGGTPSTSNSSAPVVQYNTPGIYDVTLTVSNNAGSSTITRQGVIVVSESVAPTMIPFTEDFESVVQIPSGYQWMVENAAGNGWSLTNSASFSGSQSMRLVNHTGNPAGTVDAFITPTYNLTNITNAAVNFRLAFAVRSTNSSDQLKVYASNNCGSQWNVRYTNSGLNLTTAGLYSSYFSPTSAHWRLENINLNTVAYNNKPSVRLKFEYNHDTGNNMYIDDINITGTPLVGIQDVDFLTSLTVAPNPARGNAFINFMLGFNSSVQIEVLDISGRVIEIVEAGILHSGKHRYEFGGRLQPGIYMMRFHVNGGSHTEKVIFIQ